MAVKPSKRVTIFFTFCLLEDEHTQGAGNLRRSRCQGLFPVAQLIDPHGEQDDQSDDDLLGECGHAVHVQPVAQDADHERADGRSGDGSHAADQRGAADHGGRDGVEFVHHAFVGLGRHEARHQHAAGQARQGAGDHVGEQHDGIHLHARQAGRFRVGADGVDVPPQACAGEQDGRRDGDDDHQHHRVRNAREGDVRKALGVDALDAEQRAVAQFAERFAQPGHRAGAGDLQCHAARDQHHAQRGDEGRQLRLGHQQAVDRAAGRAGEDAERHADGHRHAGLHGQCRQHPGQRQHRAHGEVDAAGDDHERGAHAQQRDRRDLERHRHAVADGEEGFAREGEDQDEQEQSGQRGELLDEIFTAVVHGAIGSRSERRTGAGGAAGVAPAVPQPDA